MTYKLVFLFVCTFLVGAFLLVNYDSQSLDFFLLFVFVLLLFMIGATLWTDVRFKLVGNTLATTGGAQGARSYTLKPLKAGMKTVLIFVAKEG